MPLVVCFSYLIPLSKINMKCIKQYVVKTSLNYMFKPLLISFIFNAFCSLLFLYLSFLVVNSFGCVIYLLHI